jgi:hypothetical protein
MHTQAPGAVGQDVQQTLPTDGVAAAHAEYLFPLDIDNLVFQTERGLLDFVRGIGALR